MGPIALVLVALGVLGTGYVLTRKQDQSPDPSGARVSRFKGQLHKSQLYRVWARVDQGFANDVRSRAPQGVTSQAFLTETLKQALGKMGFDPVYLATQDPTDATVWTFITRWSLASDEAFDVPVIRLYQLQAVQEPPGDVTSSAANAPGPASLDPGVTAEEAHAVAYALGYDDDPKHLGGFASTFDVDFPVTAALLRAKMNLVNARNMRGAMTGSNGEPIVCSACGKKRAKLWSGRTRVCSPTCARAVQVTAKRRAKWTPAPGLISCPPDPSTGGFELSDITDAAKKTIDTLTNAVSDLGDAAADVWNKYGGVVEVMGGWIPGPQIWAGETAVKLLKGAAEDKNLGSVLSEQSKRFARGMQATSPFVAMIPGLGTGVAMMMNASAAIALAEPLDQVAIETVAGAIPGGPVAQSAFRTAATFGEGMLRGQAWDEAAVNAAREAVPEELRPAFDAGLALARGKSLQDAGFQALYSWTKGNDLADKAAHFAENVTRAVQQGKDVKQVLIEEAYRDLRSSPALQKLGTQAASSMLDKTVTAISKDPTLLQNFASDVASKLGVPEEVARAAMQAVNVLPGNIVQVDPVVLAQLNPTKNLNQMPLSAAAITMIYATRRPEGSLVTNPAVLTDRLNKIVQAAAAGDPNGVKAKDALDRAQRALDRHTWVDWYKKVEQAQAQGQAAATLTGPVFTKAEPSVTSPRPAQSPAVVSKVSNRAPSPAMVNVKQFLQ